jgi:selenocysteine-specific elongation factor
VEVIVGTAGHIDHGKTALVKALTGVDADRLPEEKRRGITIDLGFAEMSVGETHFGFVDVPGHERFVKNMLAGASGIDLVLLVVAADEGVMPQTREHFDICRLLGVESGLVALTKSDLVDADTLEIARLDVAELVAGSFLDEAPVVAVSSKTGDGMDDLRRTLVEQSLIRTPRGSDLVTRLPIDRSFTIKGFGAVVTGTLASGEIAEGEELELLPDRKKVRVRGLQSHGKKAARVTSGRRVAVNLGGVDHSEIVRGMTLVEPNVLDPTQSFDAEVEVLATAARPLRSRQRVRVHIGTAEALARVQVLNENGEIEQGKKDLIQLRLESTIVAVPGDMFIIRNYSPQATIAGGTVIDNAPERHRRSETTEVRGRLTRFLKAGGDALAIVRLLADVAGPSGITLGELQAKTGFRKAMLEKALDVNAEQRAVVDLGGRYLAAAAFQQLAASAEVALAAFHKKDPIAKGMPREELRERALAFLPDEIVDGVLSAAAAKGTIVLDKGTVRLSSHRSELSPEESLVSEKILSIYQTAGLEVQKLDDVLKDAVAGTTLGAAQARKFLQRFVDAGTMVKVTDEFYFSRPVIDRLIAKMKAFAGTTADRLIDVAKFKELAGVSRKYAIPLLEYFDREHVTARVGDKRIIR